MLPLILPLSYVLYTLSLSVARVLAVPSRRRKSAVTLIQPKLPCKVAIVPARKLLVQCVSVGALVGDILGAVGGGRGRWEGRSRGAKTRSTPDQTILPPGLLSSVEAESQWGHLTSQLSRPTRGGRIEGKAGAGHRGHGYLKRRHAWLPWQCIGAC